MWRPPRETLDSDDYLRAIVVSSCSVGRSNDCQHLVNHLPNRGDDAIAIRRIGIRDDVVDRPEDRVDDERSCELGVVDRDLALIHSGPQAGGDEVDRASLARVERLTGGVGELAEDDPVKLTVLEPEVDHRFKKRVG